MTNPPKLFWHPLAWLMAPGMVKSPPPEGGSWYRTLMPDYTVQWHAVPGLSDWSIDLTKVQVFLLIATLAGALFRFSGFASITALALLIVSVPAYLSFTWDWVVLFLVLGSVSLYLQTAPSRGPGSLVSSRPDGVRPGGRRSAAGPFGQRTLLPFFPPVRYD